MSSSIDLAEIQRRIDNLESLTETSYQLQIGIILSIIVYVFIIVVFTYISYVLYTYERSPKGVIVFGSILAMMTGCCCIGCCIWMNSAKSKIVPAAKEVIDCVASNEDCSDILVVPDDKGISISFTYDKVHTSIERNIKHILRKEKTEIVNYANSLFTYRSERK